MVAAKELREKEINIWISAVLSQERRWIEVRLAAFRLRLADVPRIL